MDVVRAVQSDAVCECSRVAHISFVCNNVLGLLSSARSFNCRPADMDVNELHVCKRCCEDTDLHCCFAPPVRVLSPTYTRRAESELRETSPSLTVAPLCAAMQPKTYRDVMSGPHRPTQRFDVCSLNKTQNNKSFKSSLLVETSA